MPPAISIVVPVWNGEAYLAEAIDSILGQRFADFEVIVVDDGSTDRTWEILQSYRDPRLKCHRLEHAGIVVALNFGVSQAQAEWIARQDADDISLPERLEAQWSAVQQHPTAVLCYTDVEFFGDEAEEAGYSRFAQTKAFIALRLCYQCSIVHTAVMFRKAPFLAVAGYRQEERHAEDFAVWGRLLEKGDFIGIPKRLVLFRRHPQSVSKTNLAVQVALKDRIAIEHCRRFMDLKESDAVRAHSILSTELSRRRWSDWVWFLTRCALRLRWQSAEMWLWLTAQTIKLVFQRG